ncbi:hypothetical protein CBD41_05810 [bacterium TMED181]|nr:hypothetical protein [Planctomycetota bacterium]OUW44386.1 MAG: hypothetical protein CBD41_05810 [bacterium TMED181]
MSGMGTGTKIGFILIAILVVIVIANLLDNKVQSGPSGEDQVTGRSSSIQPAVKKANPPTRVSSKTSPVTASGRIATGPKRPVRPVRSPQQRPSQPSTSAASDGGANSGQLSRGTARLDQAQLARTTGVIRDESSSISKSEPTVAGPSKVTPTESRAAASIPVAPKRKFRKVVVEEGDSLWRIAERHLGSGSAWKKIADANSGVNENTVLKTGFVLKIPTNSEAPAVKQRPLPTVSLGDRSYQIQEGDSLWRIASEELGEGTRWQEIKEANPGVNLDVLKVGKIIQLPS